jgi:hypothetical protein
MSDRTSIKSILLLAANPKGTKSLRLQEEEREIKERLRLSGYGKIPINSAGAVRPIDIQQAMLDFDPHIVHFSGHGAGQDGLVFEDAIGQEKLVDSEALAELFELFAEKVECVVLNACYSKFQAEAIAEHIDYVIGMSKAIGDNAAIKFSVGFYAALGAGRPFKFAYKLGCNAIRLELERSPEYLTPIIWEKGHLIDTRQNNLTPRTQVPNPRSKEEGERQQPPQQPTPKIPSKPLAETDDLSSDKGVDYTKLRDLVAQGQWREADVETLAVMLKVAGREKDDWLRVKDIEKFPCTDLRTIDTLWVKYSKGRFGFSVQKRIWESVGGTPETWSAFGDAYETYQRFGDRVGWLVNSEWLNHNNLSFTLKAPEGHLPWEKRERVYRLSRRDL